MHRTTTIKGCRPPRPGLLAPVGVATAAAETCRGERATIVGTSDRDIVGTQGRDVVVTNRSSEVNTPSVGTT